MYYFKGIGVEIQSGSSGVLFVVSLLCRIDCYSVDVAVVGLGIVGELVSECFNLGLFFFKVSQSMTCSGTKKG